MQRRVLGTQLPHLCLLMGRTTFAPSTAPHRGVSAEGALLGGGPTHLPLGQKLMGRLSGQTVDSTLRRGGWPPRSPVEPCVGPLLRSRPLPQPHGNLRPTVAPEPEAQDHPDLVQASPVQVLASGDMTPPTWGHIFYWQNHPDGTGNGTHSCGPECPGPSPWALLPPFSMAALPLTPDRCPGTDGSWWEEPACLGLCLQFQGLPPEGMRSSYSIFLL